MAFIFSGVGTMLSRLFRMAWTLFQSLVLGFSRSRLQWCIVSLSSAVMRLKQRLPFSAASMPSRPWVFTGLRAGRLARKARSFSFAAASLA